MPPANLSKRDRYHFCPRCGIVTVRQEFHLSPEEERKRYEKHDNSPQNAGYVSYLEKIIKTSVLPFLPAGSHILDYGSGPQAVFSDLLGKRGYRVRIFDPFFAPEEPQSDEAFDGITLVEVAEHLKDPGEVFGRLAGRLATGGSLIVRTLVYDTTTDFSRWWYQEDPTHVSFYSQFTLELIARFLGLEFSVITPGSCFRMLKQHPKH